VDERFPDGLGVVVKIAHGWNPAATWVRRPRRLGRARHRATQPLPPLHRQKPFVVPGVVPPIYQSALMDSPSWDEWDPDTDRWYPAPGAGGEREP
jgi:hypothetical protein